MYENIIIGFAIIWNVLPYYILATTPVYFCLVNLSYNSNA